MSQQITWDFFHPYFYLLLNKYNTCKLGTITFDKVLGKLTADFYLSSDQDYTTTDMNIQLFTFIDELCGLFVYKLDPQFHFTTSLNLDIVQTVKDSKFNVLLSLILNDSKKKIIQIKVYGSNGSLVAEGISVFKKPRGDIPMAKF
jgi:hypothetical protein